MARVGIDLDGVVVNFIDSYRQHCKKEHGWNLEAVNYPEPTHWEFYRDSGWGGENREWFEKCLKQNPSIFSDAKPYPGAIKELTRLYYAGHTIVFITDREVNPRAEKITRKWLETYLPGEGVAGYELHITADKASVDVDYFIDDKPENVKAVMKKRLARAYLLDRPWNRDGEERHGLVVAGSLQGWVDLILLKEDLKLAKPRLAEQRVTSSTGGQKGKKLARFDLIPPRAMRKVAEVYGRGAEKYDDWNWRKGYDWSLSIAALERHFNDFKDGKSYHEDGHSLGSVVFHALALMTFEEEHPEMDDRFKKGIK